MAYIHIDVDLDEFDTDELVDEVCDRLKKSSRKSLTDKQRNELKLVILDLQESLRLSPIEDIEIKTLDDKMKYEHIANVFSKYTSSQVEAMLP